MKRDAKGRELLEEVLEAWGDAELRPMTFRKALRNLHSFMDFRATEIDALKAALREYNFYDEDPEP